MTPDEVRALRRKLKLTTRKLAEALGTDAETVFAWESGQQFPTKRHCDALRALAQSASADVKPGSRPAGLHALADPDLWAIVRKLAAHPELFSAVRALARDYEDPVND